MNSRIGWMVFSCLIMVSLVLPSCMAAAPAQEGEKQVIEGEVKEQEASEEEAKTENGQEEEEEVAQPTGPQYGGSITLRQLAAPISWDVAVANWSASLWAGTHYEKLLEGDVDKADREGVQVMRYFPRSLLRGQLAESWEWPDPLTLVLNIRKGVYFQNKEPANGRELEAKDVAVSLRRTREVPRFRDGYWSWMKTLTPTDKHTLEIELSRYDNMWWFYLSAWYCEIYPREAVEQDVVDDWRYAAGTGPWVLEDYVADVGATWVKNPNYWDTTTIDGEEYELPFADTLKKLIIPDSATYLAAFRTGKVDYLYYLTPDQFEDIRRTTSDLETERYLTGGAVDTLIFNVTRPPLDSREVRKALFMGIDYKDMLQSLWGDEGVIPNTFIMNPRWKKVAPQQAVPDDELPAEVVEAHTYNPEKAEQLLAEAGYPNGFKTKILINTTEQEVDMASLLAGYWSKIGVELEIKAIEPARHQNLVLDHDYDMVFYGWGGDPPFSIVPQLHPVNMRNLSRWEDPHFTELIETYQAERDPDKINQLVKDINAYQAQGFTINTPVYPYQYSVWWPWIKNYNGRARNSIFSHAHVLARMWVDQELKTEMGH